MKPEKIREMSEKEMLAKVTELRQELMKVRFEGAVTQIKNPLKKRELRRDIARILTIINEKRKTK